MSITVMAAVRVYYVRYYFTAETGGTKVLSIRQEIDHNDPTRIAQPGGPTGRIHAFRMESEIRVVMVESNIARVAIGSRRYGKTIPFENNDHA